MAIALKLGRQGFYAGTAYTAISIVFGFHYTTGEFNLEQLNGGHLDVFSPENRSKITKQIDNDLHG